MKLFEILKTDTKKPKLTVTTTRVTIKVNKVGDFTKEIEFLKKVADENIDCTFTLRGKIHNDSICLVNGHGKSVFYKKVE